MSLVVAQKHGNSIVIVSDTQVSSPSNKKLGIFEGVIKCVVLSHSCTIAFAGEIETARVTYESVEALDKAQLIRDCIIGEMLKQHVASDSNTDFLLAFMSSAELVCIKNGEVRRNCLSAWIGEPTGFEMFQNALNSTLSSPAGNVQVRLLDDNPDLPNGLVSRMLDAMNMVASNVSLPTVGGLAIAAIGSGGLFRYAEQIILDAPVRGDIHSGEFEVLLQGASTGQCTVFMSFVLGKRGSLFPITYFVEANLLLLHPTRMGVAPLKIRAHSFDEALHILQEKMQLYNGTELPRQDNFLKAISQTINVYKEECGRQLDFRLDLVGDQWRPGGRRIPIEIKVIGASIIFDDTRLSVEEEKLVKNGHFLLVHSDGDRRYTIGDMYQRLVFEYPWLPTMSYDQRCQVTVFGPCDLLGKQLVKADLGGHIFELKKLSITANIHSLPEFEWL